MGDHSESLVEVPDRQTDGDDCSKGQLRIVSNRIKSANFRKISGGGRRKVDSTSHHGEEENPEQADRMLNDGESSQCEVNASHGDVFQLNHAHQSFSKHDGDNQALGHLHQGEAQVEEGSPGSMEVERH
nr:hypothetical protein CFP56_70352 [Quercus suber]